MDTNENEKFYLVANSRSQAGIPVPVLVNPPKAMQQSEIHAEAEAVRLAIKTGDRFFILEAVAYVDVVDGVPRWTDLNNA